MIRDIADWELWQVLSTILRVTWMIYIPAIVGLIAFYAGEQHERRRHQPPRLQVYQGKSFDQHAEETVRMRRGSDQP
jgi:hypothetical protein